MRAGVDATVDYSLNNLYVRSFKAWIQSIFDNVKEYRVHYMPLSPYDYTSQRTLHARGKPFLFVFFQSSHISFNFKDPTVHNPPLYVHAHTHKVAEDIQGLG